MYAQDIDLASPSAIPSGSEIATSSAMPIAPMPSIESSTSSLPIQPDLLLPTPTTAQKSAAIRQPARVHKIQKRQFLTRESIDITVESDNPDSVTVHTIGPQGEKKLPITHTPIAGGVQVHIEPPADFVPGKYTVTVADSVGVQTTQEFLWGVLAINTNKSIYKPNEQATIAIAVLDELGRMVCDADVTLTIKSPSSDSTTLSTKEHTISVNDECTMRDIVFKPDYETRYVTTGIGTYQMTLTAITANGTYTITDAFEVRDSVLFDVERITSTRIYPIHTYPVRLSITANTDFTGTIIESVPQEFMISPLDSVASYSAVRVGFSPQQNASANEIYLQVPFEGTYTQTSAFGSDIEDPMLKEKYHAFGLSGHDGLDFALPEDTPVLAAGSGKVALAGAGAYGTTVVIQHTWGRSYYGHLKETTVSKGDRVYSGQPIGQSGQTGLATGPHLHFGIRPRQKNMTNGYFGKVDPTSYLDNPPSDFESPHTLISWNVSLKKGESTTLGYQYKAPLISPKLYRAGPLKFIQKSPDVLGDMNTVATQSAAAFFDLEDDTILPESIVQPAFSGRTVFEEIRQWQIASDDAIGWYNSAWTYRIKLIIDRTKVSADQTDFPVYVNLNNLPAAFHSHVNQTDARDIRVTKDDGTTELPREVVFYTAASDTGELHFKYTGTLSSTVDTDVYIYYGNASASDYATTDTYGRDNVWDANYVGVWHLTETSGQHADSSGTGNNSSSLSVATQGSANAKIGGADDFNATTNYINLGTSTSLNLATNGTIEAWIFPDGWGEGGYGSIVARGAGSNVGYQFYTASARSSTSLWDVGRIDATTNSLSLSSWQSVAVSINNNTGTFYVNGVSSGGGAFSLDASGTTTAYIGSFDGSADTFDGQLDEIRISSTARSSTWLSTQYNNQNSPSTFFSSFGTETTSGPTNEQLMRHGNWFSTDGVEQSFTF